jgi:hypothetical protein
VASVAVAVRVLPLTFAATLPVNEYAYEMALLFLPMILAVAVGFSLVVFTMILVSIGKYFMA